MDFGLKMDDTGHAILSSIAASCLSSARVSMALRRVSLISGQVPNDRRLDIRESQGSVTFERELATRYAQKPRETLLKG